MGTAVPDLVVPDNSDVTRVLFGNGDGTFTTKTVYSDGGQAASVVVGDFNGDGFEDIAVDELYYPVPRVAILLGNGDGTFTLKSLVPVASQLDFPTSIAIGDFNGDGIPDLVSANYYTANILLGNGDGTFTTKSTLGLGESSMFVAVGDFNGDGIPDLAIVRGNENAVLILLGKGDGTFILKSSLDVGGPARRPCDSGL